MDEQMLSVYRHDAHKMRGQSHGNAPETWFDVPVNGDVPYGADKDAAEMSRPKGKPEQQLPGHKTHYRRSVITGNTPYDPNSFALGEYKPQLKELLSGENAQETHEAWLKSDLVSAFNESVYAPYTSLKYHTLLVAALVDNYRNGHGYDDLGVWLSLNAPIVPHRTVFRATHDGQTMTLTIKPHERGESSKLSSYPIRNFASVWTRLPKHPWRYKQTDFERRVDSQLRRMRSWSTALQYLEHALKGEYDA